jgi:hypothetical protein
LTQNELEALIAAGFKISPAPESPLQTVTPDYYQPTTKRQRSYVTPSPTQLNQVSYQSRQNKPEQEKENVQEVSSLGEERLQQRGQAIRYQPQEIKSQREEDEGVQYVRRPETQNIRQGVSVTRIQVVTDKPQPEEEIIHFIQIPATPQVRHRGVLTRYQPDAGSEVLPTEVHTLQDEREGVHQQTQAGRYQQEPRYQTQPDSSLHQTPSYQQDEESVRQQAPRFHPIIVAELPTTPAPRRRRPRPSNSRALYRAQLSSEQTDAPAQYLVSYDNIPEATAFGTRNSRLKSRRPTSDEES